MEKCFDGDKDGMKARTNSDAPQELSMAKHISDKYKTDGFRKKMHLHKAVALSGEFAPGAIPK